MDQQELPRPPSPESSNVLIRQQLQRSSTSTLPISIPQTSTVPSSSPPPFSSLSSRPVSSFSHSKIVTQIEYNKTSCYFCDEWLENDNFKSHINRCGQTLIRCPNDCSVFIQRKRLESHLENCLKKNIKENSPVLSSSSSSSAGSSTSAASVRRSASSVASSSAASSTATSATSSAASSASTASQIPIDNETIEATSSTSTTVVIPQRIKSPLSITQSFPFTKQPIITNNKRTEEQKKNIEDVEQRLMILEHDINAVRSALNEETRQRHRLIIDVGTLRKRNIISDEWTNKIGDVLTAMKKCLNEESESRCIDIQQARVDIGRLVIQYQEISEWRSEMQTQLDELEKDIIPDETIRSYIDVLMNDNRISAMKIYELENDIKLLKLRSDDVNRISATNDAIIIQKMTEIDEFLEENQRTKELAATHEQTNRSSSISPSTNVSKELNHKLLTMEFELKSMKHIVTDTEDKCDRLESIVTENKKTTNQTRQLLNDLDVHLRIQQQLQAIHNVRGHLIWRIDNYMEKLQQSKENDLVLQSPMFCNRQYGYTLRLDVSLNGIGTWKGRNILACLTIVSGEWDSLLPWPCKLEADIILRDQSDVLSEAKNFSKTIIAKKKNEIYEQNQYIFISHKTINSCNFLRNNAIFFEVKVHRNSLQK